MRKIDLTPYPIAGDRNFAVRASLAVLLFNESKLDPREILRRDELARKIETFEGDSILLEEAEYARLVTSLHATDLQAFGRDVVEFVRRILDAPVVPVTEKI